MAAIPDPIKEFIVTRYAMYERPTEIARLVKEQFDVDLLKQQVDRYNPEGRAGRRGEISKRLVALFHATRAKFDETVDMIPIANKTYRLHRLNQMFEKNLDRGAFAIAAQMLEQAAKEVGETFTNKREHKHSGTVAVEELSTEDKRTALVDRMADAAATAAAAALRAAAEAGPPTIQ